MRRRTAPGADRTAENDPGVSMAKDSMSRVAIGRFGRYPDFCTIVGGMVLRVLRHLHFVLPPAAPPPSRPPHH